MFLAYSVLSRRLRRDEMKLCEMDCRYEKRSDEYVSALCALGGDRAGTEHSAARWYQP